ncbi:MAG: response regulator [Candidatus Marinimicrobia bacterium]|nr:response regulator [Candidatus Neomarinimicrobiota bacterium]
MKAKLLIIEQHRHHAEDIYRDIHSLFEFCQMASSVKEAEILIHEYLFDMVIINPFFADGNGRLFIREMKNNVQLRNTPVVVLSDLPASHAKLDFYSYGADAYIEVPYEKEWFKNTVRDELLMHFQLLANNGRDKNTEFSSRAEFEEDYINDQKMILEKGEKGIIGLVAPAGIDFVIRDLGLETGNKLMAAVSNLMRRSCSNELQAAIWTQKSIVFALMNKPEEDVRDSLQKLRKEFLKNFKEITKLQKTPGLRAVLSNIPIDKSLQETMSKLSNQLVQISKNPNADPIQFYGDNITLKRHVMIADPDPVAVNVIQHRLKKDGFEPLLFQKTSDLLTYSSKAEIAAILIDSMVAGGGIDMIRQIHKEPDLSEKPLMLLSRYGYEDEIANAFKAGAEDYMLKPISLVELSARMKRLTG